MPERLVDDGEVVGTCCWVVRPGPGTAGGVLNINGEDYKVEPFVFAGRRVGFLVGQYEVLMLDSVPPSCSCPDFLYRRNPIGKSCKHCKALKSALEWLRRRKVAG